MSADPGVAKITIELLESYIHGDPSSEYVCLYGDRMEAETFLQEVFEQRKCDDCTKDSATELFFKVLKNERFLSAVLQEYYKSRSRRFPIKPNDSSLGMVFFHYIISELNPGTLAAIQKLLMDINTRKALAVAGFVKKPRFLSLLYHLAAQIWDIEYVKSNVLCSVEESLFKELYDGMCQIIEERQRSQQKALTKPIEMNVLKRTKPRKYEEEPMVSVSPSDTMSEVYSIKPVPIPKTTYIKPNYEKRLEEGRMKNQEKAKDLYREAQRHAFRVANLPKKCFESEEKIIPVVRSKLPVIKEPSIRPKKTAAVILREGARLMKMEQDEIRRLEDIMRGAFNSGSLKELEMEIQEEKMRKHVEEIEKKHLQGLLTYEEAVIAKQKYLKRTKEAADEFRKEKEVWMKQLEAWRAEEQDRIRESVEKGKSYERGAKEAVEHVKEEKHRIALETMEESRSLKEKWLAEKEEELKRKIQLIKEIKALQAFGAVRRKEAMASMSASIGLLCEMTTEELKERLFILRLEFKEELERRREEIKQRKECRRAIVDGYRDLIEQHQGLRKQKTESIGSKSRSTTRSPVRSSSVEALRKKLDEKRKERLQHAILKEKT